ncbi:MAG: hypothetical protein J6W81_10210, partial [Lentisphaeria bacterium]|nr:hypothetical protein [Lentisphaeria bacterium]
MKVSIVNLTLNADGLSHMIDSELHPFIAAYCGVKQTDVISYKISKRSVDARKKPEVRLVYTLTADLADSARPKRDIEYAAEEFPIAPPRFEYKKVPLHPVIIGSGPAGLFCGLILAMAGCKPLILDRGRDVDRRRMDIQTFFNTRELNEESNLLFGEGGAGTWSDGKLFTRIRDPRIQFVLNEFIAAGAPEAIGYYSHPHLGSDKLPDLIANIRNKIIALGGTFRWDATVKELAVKNGICTGVYLADNELIEAPMVIAACGHSARDLILSMTRAGAGFTMKGFQMGCRIEHPQDFINWFQFGNQKTNPALGSAEYNMVSHPTSDKSIEGATTFCMCPGGEIIPATPTAKRLCTNGMSNAARSGKFANAAIVTNIPPDVFDTPEDAYAALDLIEKRAFIAGGNNYDCPAQRASDFVKKCTGKIPSKTSWPFGLRSYRVDKLFPEAVSDALTRALLHFDRNAPGYIRWGTMLGVETRVSSPVRFLRDPET